MFYHKQLTTFLVEGKDPLPCVVNKWLIWTAVVLAEFARQITVSVGFIQSIYVNLVSFGAHLENGNVIILVPDDIKL